MLNRVRDEAHQPAPAGASRLRALPAQRGGPAGAAEERPVRFSPLVGAMVGEAVEREKARISRDLHDDVLQALFALKLEAARLAAQIPATPGPAQERLQQMDSLIDATSASVRRLAAGLRPVQLRGGLEPALRDLALRFTADTGVPCRFEAATPLAVDSACADAAFRIAQEALQNVRKHAGAREAGVAVRVAGRHLLLQVTDDGCGFGPDAARPDAMGLPGMRERACLAGGDLLVDSRHGGGTRVRARLPLQLPRPPSSSPG